MTARYVESSGVVWGPPVKPVPKPPGWRLPEDSIGGDPQQQRDRWPSDPKLRGPKLKDPIKLPGGI